MDAVHRIGKIKHGALADAGTAAAMLRQVAPTRIAEILRGVSPGSLRQELLGRLPERLRASVRRYLGG